MPDLDLLDLLSGDHQNLLDEEVPSVTEVAQHLSVERDLLYPVIRRHLPEGEAIIEGLRRTDRRLEEILDASESAPPAQLRQVLSPAVRAHITDTERLFARLRQRVPSAELVRAVETVPLSIGGSPTHGHPHLAEGGPVGEIVEDAASVADHVRDRVHGHGAVPEQQA